MEKQERIAAILQDIGEVYKALQKYAKAFEYYNQAMELEQQLGRDNMVTRLHDKIEFLLDGVVIWTLIQQREFEEAKELSRIAYDHDPQEWKWAAALNLGHTYLLTNDQTTAREYYEKALQLMQSKKDFQEAMKTFNILIEQDWQKDACRQELAWMQQEFDKVYRFHIEADKYWDQAIEFGGKEQFSEALQLYEKSIELEQASAEPRLEYLTIRLGIIGFNCKQMGRYTEALEYYTRALELEREMGWEDKLTVEYLYEISDVFQKQHWCGLSFLGTVCQSARLL